MYLNGTKCAALALSCLLSFSVMAKNTIPSVGQGVQKPLTFIENNGQITDNNGTILNDIAFKMSTPGMNLYVGNGELHYQFRKLEDATGANPVMKTYRMDVTLLGANKNAQVITSDKQAYYEKYYNQHTAATGITASAYNKITYKEVYPGIDWVLYVKGDNVEYDFVVRPGADANLIKLQYGGATNLSITPDGGIAAITPMGKVQEKKPFAYENATGKEVAANFKLQGNIVSFETAKSNGTLTIDPFILWSTYFGGANEDVATAVKITGGGNAYIGGYTSSAGLGFGGAFDVTFNAVFDAFITKYDAAGLLQFTAYFGGTGNDRGTCLALNAAGTGIFLGGVTNSAGLSTAGAYRTALSGPTDGFLLRVDNNGNRIWSTYYGGPAGGGGTGNDAVNGVAVDAANNIYITGRTESASLIATAGVYQTALSGTADAFIAKFNGASGTGANIYSTYYGGTGIDEGAGITVDGANNPVITGQTNSIVSIASTGAYQTTLSGANDAFVAKLNNTATTRLWGTYFGGTGSEQGTEAICNTTNGAVGVIGYTSSTSGIASANAHQPSYGGGVQDAFVAYFTTAGAVAWSTYYGGSGLDYGESICLDPSRNLVIAGGTFSTNGIATAGSLQPAIGGNYDAYVAKFTQLGQRMWGTYFGNALYDYGFGVACDNGGQILLAGHTTSTAGIATVGAAQAAYGGGTYDGFLTKFRTDTFALIVQPFTDTLVCAGGQLRVNYQVNFNYQPGNVFSVQMSDITGSFAAPVVIGTLTSSTTGNIICTIPAGTTLGTGYRIRLVASNPAYTSVDNFLNITVVGGLPAVTVGANTPLCVGNTLFLTATATWSISSYAWAGPAAYVSALQNPTRAAVTLAHAGTYSVTTTHNGCPTATATVDVVVNDFTPPPPVAFASALNCNGGTLYLYADTASTLPGNYSWSGPAGFTSNVQSPVISPISAANAGNYFVVDTVDGCPSTATLVTVTITPNTLVSLSINVSPNDTICGGTMVDFSTVATNPGVTPAYQWMIGSMPVVGAMSPTWSSSTLTDGSEVSCVLNSNALCPFPASASSNTIKMNVITNELMVYIFANPGVSVNPGDSITFTSTVYNAGVGATYQWLLNGGDIFGATNTTYTKLNVTRYDTVSLLVTSIMACTSPSIKQSNKLTIRPNTSVEDMSSLMYDISLFPNPNDGNFTISGDLQGLGSEVLSVAVINPLGQVVYSKDAMLIAGTLNEKINTGNLPSGIYMLQVSAEGRSKTLRFSVQH